MCFSAEVSFGAAAALLPVGGYCLATAWRKDRAYLLLAATPVLFGLQQLCEVVVWAGVSRGDPDAARPASLVFLFFALALWPVWVPLMVAAVEPPGWVRRGIVALTGLGALFGAAYYLPIAADGGHSLNPVVVGHSLRYDLSVVPATRSPLWWVWPAVYLAAVCVPLLVSRNRLLHPIGAVVAASAAVTYAVLEQAFASVWCFFAALISVYLAYVLYRLPEQAVAPDLLNPRLRVAEPPPSGQRPTA